MNQNHTCLSIRLASVAVAVASLAQPLVANAQGSRTAQQLYREALEACSGSQRTQSRADCMNEARSVLRDAREGRAWTRDGGMDGMREGAAQMDRDMPTAMQRDRTTPSAPKSSHAKPAASQSPATQQGSGMPAAPR